ncbi:MAG: hypothetical protein VX733_05975 [Candidatus Latescibacterota bacterium]|nr:hypothetical protein [Candidatus Latescibacterota bacterium]
MNRLRLLILPLIVLSASATYGASAQDRDTEQVDPDLEVWLRQHLRKLHGWGITQLLRTEQKVDDEQKRRANVSTNPRELAILANDEDSGVRFFVASNHHTPLGTKLFLASDSDPTVRSGIALTLAHDERASETIREVTEALALKLAADSNVLVRLSLLENRRLPESIYDFLAVDGDLQVRRKVASSLHAPQSALIKLASDSISVAMIALQHRNLPPQVMQDIVFGTTSLPGLTAGEQILIRRAISSNPNASSSVLDTLARHVDSEVRRLAAVHPNTPLATLEHLARDLDLTVVLGVAQHPRADRALLMRLAYDDRDPQIRLVAQDRLEPLLREEIRDDMLERWDPGNRMTTR